jgi:hypothetical protein
MAWIEMVMVLKNTNVLPQQARVKGVEIKLRIKIKSVMLINKRVIIIEN